MCVKKKKVYGEGEIINTYIISNKYDYNKYNENDIFTGFPSILFKNIKQMVISGLHQ